MRKYLYSFIALGALLYTSCSTEMPEETISQTREIPQSIVVNFESDTRVHLEGGKTTPTVGDLFYVFNKINHCDTYIYNGNTNEDGKAIIEFRDTTGYTQHTAMDKLVIIYNESQPELYVNNGSPTTATVVVKSSQKYTKDSYAISAAPMVSVSDDNGSVMFKNICGWVKLSLTGNGETIKKIEFSGNNNEGLAFGSNPPTKIDVNDLSVYSVGHPFKKLTMTFDNDNKEDNWDTATLSSTPTDFYFSMPPVEFTNGFTVKITCTDGTEMTKSTSKKIKINRNEIQAMEPFAYAGEQIELDFSNMSIAQFNDLTYTQGYANTFEVKLANGNEIGNSFFIFYNPDYQPSGEGDAGTLNGEYEIVVTEIGTKSFDKKVFIADASYCYFTDDGSTYYFKSGTVTVSGSNATTKIAFNAVVTSKDGTELPLVGECTLNDMGYTKSESNTLTGLGIIGFVYNTSTVTGTTTIQGYDKETSPTKLITIAMKCNNINNLYGNEFSTSSTTNKITSGSLYLAEGTGVEYPYINGAVTIAQGTSIKSIITFNNMKFIDGAGNIYNIVNPDSGSTSLPLKQGTIQDVGGGW